MAPPPTAPLSSSSAATSRDPAGPLVRSRVSRTYRRTAYALQILTVRDENDALQTLRVTEEHPFFVESVGWTPARSLEAGDRLLGAEGTLAVVSNQHEAHPQGVTVYNLEVEQAHTYFVLAEDATDAGDAVWVHNSKYSAQDVHPDLPNYTGGRSKGVFVGGNQKVKLTSGTKGGPGASLIDTLPNLSDDAVNAAIHLEGHAAALMQANQLEEASLFINYFKPGKHPGPCPFCTSGVGELMPAGSRLWVSYPTPSGVGTGYFVGGKKGFNVVLGGRNNG